MPIYPGEYPIPYDRYGNLLRQLSDTQHPEEIDWRPNDPFNATLRLVERRRKTGGWHPERFWWWVWADEHGREYPMFPSDYQSMLTLGLLAKRVTGRWRVRKKGFVYGVVLADAQELLV